ncbi:HAMP domain-containing histidine kinase [Rhizobium sp. P38BS-XIX]|nr:HAMP domain-containing histidine kinase [Rhizobium sp. P38BS-XIX]
MSALTVAAFAVIHFGWYVYWTFVYDWLFPDIPDTDRWNTADFIVLGVILVVGLTVAAFVGWLQAQVLLRPIQSVAAAARAIASGNLSARAKAVRGSFGEAETLLIDFNTMASRLESAEAELEYSKSAIAHELRTPLTILRGRLQGLLDGVFHPSKELYERLITHVDDLTRIVEDLRTLDVFHAGQLDLKLGRIDLAEEVRSVIDAIEHDLSNAAITVNADLAGAAVMADRARIRQILFAILENARRYAPGSIVTIKTSVSGGRASILCSDTGPGLSLEATGRMFDRFWRSEQSRARVNGGSGLGLPIVRALARAHGGDATAFPNDRKGTSIEIWLPTDDTPDTPKLEIGTHDGL